MMDLIAYFAFCPLNSIADCGGVYETLPNGKKDCSKCILPHRRDNYDTIIKKIIKE